MVNYEVVEEKKLTKNDFAIAGAFSGFMTRGLCQPLDVLKIRFQLQVEKIAHHHEGKYKSILHAIQLMIAEEGFLSLWKGHVPAQWLSVVYGMAQFWCFESLTSITRRTPHLQNHKHISNFACGAISGGVATLSSFPFDVIRTRLIAQGEEHKLYSGFIHCSYHIIRHEGVPVLFRGLLPTFIQVVPYAGVQFMSYKFFVNIFKSLMGSKEKDYSFSSSLTAGSIAGLFAKIAVYPLDVTKKRLQIQGIEHIRKPFGKVFSCQGMMDCIRKIYAIEGVIGFYKGLNPSLLKAVVTSGMYFATYELMCKIIVDLKS
ncbi:mitochondrial thiamine pyrophosphate carrier-like [Agrilus planipennis]|uniref:Mitochondrial thiamine pyrophosphate carrier n=1 Tax=Agrilus planipennis TaxID=224129 RepID=A0A7F5R4R1_AGRPL|nr:mitochondrial thiamine pyrophosphate carrier-like [Agrilus planipennis]